MLKATDSDHHCHELDNPTDCKSSFTLASLIATTEWRSRNQIVQILQSVRIADSADCCNSQSDTCLLYTSDAADEYWARAELFEDVVAQSGANDVHRRQNGDYDEQR